MVIAWKDQVQYSSIKNTGFSLRRIFSIFESKLSKTCEYQPEELYGGLIKNNHEKRFYPSKDKFPEVFTHEVLPLLFLFRDEKQMLSGSFNMKSKLIARTMSRGVFHFLFIYLFIEKINNGHLQVVNISH